MSDKVQDLKKLCVMNVKESDSDDSIRKLCESFGGLVYFNRPPLKKQLAFPLYASESDAQRAKDGLTDQGYKVQFALISATRRNDNSSEDTSYEFRAKPATPRSENGLAEADSSISDRPYGKCIKCGDKAYHTCGRCLDFYCSEDCQIDDWLAHKRVCFPMPKLVPAKSTHSLYLSRNNIAASKENLKVTEMNQVGSNIDAPDGHQKFESSQHQTEIVAALSAMQDPAPSVKSAADSVGDAVKPEVDDVPAPADIVQSPRQRLMSIVSNGTPKDTPPKQTPVQPSSSNGPQTSNGLVTDSIPNGSEVFITYAKNNNNLYIRSAATNDEYSKLITEIEEASKTAPKLKEFPAKNDIVMAPFFGMYYRAMVVNGDKQAGTVKVGFLDFGNAEEVLFNQLKVMPQELQEYRRLVFMVGLKNINDDVEPNEQDAMKKHLDDLVETGKGFKLKGDKAEIVSKDNVELFDLITNQSLSETLNSMAAKRYRIEDLERNIVTATDVEVMIIDSTKIAENIVACILKTDVNEVMASDEAIQAYGESVKNAPAYKPKLKELCIAKVKDTDGDAWFRCQYQQELINDKAQLYLIDYGKTNKVRENNIRAFRPDLAFKMVSFIARFKGGESFTSEQKQELAESPGIAAKSIEYDGNMHLITLA